MLHHKTTLQTRVKPLPLPTQPAPAPAPDPAQGKAVRSKIGYLPPTDRAALLREWQRKRSNGTSVQALADEYGVSLSTIHRYMPAQRYTPPPSPDLSARDQKIVALYSERVSVTEIASILGTTTHAVYRVLRDYRRQHDDPRLPKRLPRVNDNDERTVQIIDAIRAQGNIAPVARQFGLTRQRVYQLLDDYYIRHPNARRVTQNRRGVGKQGAPSKAQWVKTLLDAGVSVGRIAAVTGLAKGEIATALGQE